MPSAILRWSLESTLKTSAFERIDVNEENKHNLFQDAGFDNAIFKMN